jgi:excisionase family DNA binding protein
MISTHLKKDVPPEFMKLKTVAELLQVSVKTLYDRRRRGELRFTKIGSHNRITRTELDRFIKENTEGAGEW